MNHSTMSPYRRTRAIGSSWESVTTFCASPNIALHCARRKWAMAEAEGVTHPSWVKSCCDEIHESGYARFLDLVLPTTLRITSGCLAATLSNTRAAPSGFRLPCSQL